MARREELALSFIRGLVKRPRLANLVFRLDKWGNILGPDRFIDPYPVFERMRAAGPVSFSPFLQQWAVVGYDEAREVLRSPSFGVAGQMDVVLDARPYSRLSDRTKTLFRNALLFTDPPLHTRLRAAVSRAFTPKQMQRLEPRVQQLADDLLQRIVDEPAPELMRSIAEPLPVQVIAELIGVPEDRWAWVADTSRMLRLVLDPFAPLDPVAIDTTCDEMVAYYGELADERAAVPRDDLLSVLAGAEANGEIDRSELVSLLAILLLAGHETTTGAIGNAIVAFGHHPEQRRLLRERPELWPNAVEELLRYDTVLQTDPRVALEDVTIAGKTIRAGQNLTVMLGAANRDPRRFEDPSALRIDRANPSPISFGHGMHHCIGAALARLEMRVALPTILGALGDYTIAPDSTAWKTSLAFRSPAQLPVQRERHRTTRSQANHARRIRVEFGPAGVGARDHLVAEYASTLALPPDDMWAAFADRADQVALFHGDELIGFASIDAGGELHRCHLRSGAEELGPSLVDLVAEKRPVRSMIASTTDPVALTTLLPGAGSITPVAMLCHHETAPVGEWLDGLRTANEAEHANVVAFLAESTGGHLEDAGVYVGERIDRRELFLHEIDGEIAGVGERRLAQWDVGYAHLGIFVSHTHRGRGVGGALMNTLVTMCGREQLKPLCSTEPDNVAARRLVLRAGFRSRHSIFRLERA